MLTDIGFRSGESRSAVHLATVVWGAEYISRMLDYALPSIVAGLERAALCRKHACTFYIYTREQDIAAIDGSAIVARLRQSVAVELIAAEIVPMQRHWSVSAMHCRISNKACAENAYAVFLVPNAVYSTELFDAVGTAIADARSAMFVPSLRVKLDSVSPVLDEQSLTQDGILALNARDMAGLAFNHLHSDEKRLYWGAGEHSIQLSRLYFGVSDNAMIAACWYLLPLLARPRSHVYGARAIDSGKYLSSAGLDMDSLDVITDSDRGFFVEFPGGVRPYVAKRMSIRTCVTWALRHAQSVHRLLFAQPILIHAGEVASANLEPVRRFAAEILLEIVRDYDYRRSHSLKLWGEILLPPSVLIRMVLSPVERMLRGLTRVLYRTLVPRLKKVLFWLFTSLVFRNLVRRIMNGAGLARWAFGLFLGVAAMEIARNRATPAEDTIVGRFIFDRGLKLLDDGKLEDALNLVRTSILLSPHPERRFYEKLIATLIDLRLQAQHRAQQVRGRQYGPGGEPLIFAVVVWGQSYVEAFLDYTIRTMLAQGNLPALRNRQLIFSIVTDEGSLPLFEKSGVFQELKKIVAVEFFTFPSELTGIGHYSMPNFNFYRLYGALDHTSIHFARALGGHIFFVVADALYANGALLNLLKYLERGYEVCVNASLVANKEAILSLLDGQIGPHESLDLSNRELANLCFRYRHDYISQRLMIPANTNFDKYPRELYFPDRAGLVVHALYQHPWAISAAAIARNIEFDYHIVDFRLVSRIFAYSPSYEKLKVVEDSDEVFIANFASQDRKFDTTGEPFNIRQFVAAHLHSQPIHWHIWRHRQLIRCDTGLRPEVNPEIVANNVLVALREAIQK